MLPALVLLPLAPLEGLPDVALSAVLAIGLSVAAGAVGAALWSRLPESREVVFGDLMLWRWARRLIAERRVSRTAASLPEGVTALRAGDTGGDPLLPALCRLADELDARDSFMRGHSRRVARHAERVARQMGLPEDEVERIRAAASVHDIGKLFVPQSILAQPSGLTAGEYELVKRHAPDGAEVVSELHDPELTSMVRHHHERFDGRGYPDGLAGAEIPLGARIIAVADSYDAITSERPYRRASSHRSALDVITEEAGAQFDADVVAAFTEYCSDRRTIVGVAFFATAPQRLVGWLAATPAGVGVSAAPIAQGMCAAGAVAVMGACIGGPGLNAGPADRDSASQGARSAAIARDATAATPSGARAASGETGRRLARVDGPASRRGSPQPNSPGDRGPDDVADQPGTQAPAGQPPTAQSPAPGATTPVAPGGQSAPSGGSGGGGPVGNGAPDVAEVPSAPVTPPALPVSPPKVLDPVVDTVDRVLAPAPEPLQRVTDPLRDLLGRTGLTSPPQ